MASVVGKTIFSDGKGKLFFGYYKDNDAVEFVDYKTWKKLSFKDVSKGDTNKERVIKAIVKNQKQFNKKVDFNMWAKKQKRSFEDTMDWFIQNGWINNINKGGIKESVDVLSVNEAIKYNKDGFVTKMENEAGKVVKDITLDGEKFVLKGNKYVSKKGGKDLHKSHFGIRESVNEVKYDTALVDFNKELENDSKVKKIASYYKKPTKMIVRALQPMITVLRYKDNSIKSISVNFTDAPSGPTTVKVSKSFNQNESVNEDRNSNMFYVLYQKKGVFGKPAAAGYKDRKDAEKFAKSLGNNHNTMILDKQSMKNVKGVDVKEGKKRFKRQDGIGKAKYTISYHDGKKKHKDGSDFFDIKIFKNKKDLSDFVGSLVKQGYKLTNESVNEGSMSWEKHFKGYNEKELKVISKFIFMNPQGIDGVIKMSKKKDFKPFIQKAAKKGLGESVNESASKEAMGIAALTGTRGSAVQDFIDKNRINSRKLFNALKKANLQGRINFASALAGKPNNPNAKLTVKLFGEDKKEVIAFRKKAKSEKAFYDILDKVEKKYGRGVFEKWLDKSLKDLKINPKKYRTSAEKQEALYQAKF